MSESTRQFISRLGSYSYALEVFTQESFFAAEALRLVIDRRSVDRASVAINYWTSHLNYFSEVFAPGEAGKRLLSEYQDVLLELVDSVVSMQRKGFLLRESDFNRLAPSDTLRVDTEAERTLRERATTVGAEDAFNIFSARVFKLLNDTLRRLGAEFFRATEYQYAKIDVEWQRHVLYLIRHALAYTAAEDLRQKGSSSVVLLNAERDAAFAFTHVLTHINGIGENFARSIYFPETWDAM